MLNCCCLHRLADLSGARLALLRQQTLTTACCLAVKEPDPSFLHGLSSLQPFKERPHIGKIQDVSFTNEMEVPSPRSRRRVGLTLGEPVALL